MNFPTLMEIKFLSTEIQIGISFMQSEKFHCLDTHTDFYWKS